MSWSAGRNRLRDHLEVSLAFGGRQRLASSTDSDIERYPQVDSGHMINLGRTDEPTYPRYAAEPETYRGFVSAQQATGDRI